MVSVCSYTFRLRYAAECAPGISAKRCAGATSVPSGRSGIFFFFLLARALLATRCPSRHSAPLIDTKIRREGSGHNGIECPAGRQVARRVWRSQEGVDRPDQTNRKAPCNREHAGPPGDSEQSRRIGVTRITPRPRIQETSDPIQETSDGSGGCRTLKIETVEQPCIIALFLPYLLPTSKKHACKYL